MKLTADTLEKKMNDRAISRSLLVEVSFHYVDGGESSYYEVEDISLFDDNKYISSNIVGDFSKFDELLQCYPVFATTTDWETADNYEYH